MEARSQLRHRPTTAVGTTLLFSLVRLDSSNMALTASRKIWAVISFQQQLLLVFKMPVERGSMNTEPGGQPQCQTVEPASFQQAKGLMENYLVAERPKILAAFI